MTGITLDSPIATVLGASAKDKAKTTSLEKSLGLRTVGDLLWHFPRTYLKTGEVTEVRRLEEGQPLTIVGRVRHSRLVSGRTPRVEALLETDGPPLRLTIFARRPRIAEWQLGRLPAGSTGVFTGKVGRFQDEWQLTNPQMVMFGEDETKAASARQMVETIKALFPIYRVTGAVQTWDVARVVAFALTVVDELPDLLPADLRERQGLPDVHTAMRWIHTPDDWAQVGAARKRFRFEEALVTQLLLARRRAAVRALGARPRTGGGPLLATFDSRLPFELTRGQVDVGREIEADLGREHPMSRLLQGEVGSGKTLVALRAMLRVVDSGGQAALLAPTEVLAQQHHRSITAMLGDLAAGGMLGGAEEGTDVALLTGSMGRKARQETMLRMASGEAGIVVGTHALLEDRVQFADLGLVVVDEQHRFGVEQRAALTDKAGSPPHLLVMTATPIPRTVAMTVFGDLEVSTLRELPAGRAPVQSTVVPLREQPHWLERVWARVREEAGRGQQTYVVCPRIGGDEAEEGQVDQVDVTEEGAVLPAAREGELSAVEEVAPRLAEGPLAGLRVERLHGRLPAEEKDRVMRDFAAGRIDVLVATTVIEVGVDVANATTMVLLDADRFGVSQLHQLRGRVGRGGLPGLCLLVSHAEPGSQAMERLAAVAATADGFELSRVDLEQRHEGDVLGSSQSGFRSGLRQLRVLRDEKTIVAARSEAEALLAEDPLLAGLPLLGAAVDDLERDQRSDYLERS
ncbi:ATP-dependent DNA helicase RecG [Nocardioides donggukensis]|uniref:ATP-dependent DNA helicase RecG n=1 Tax=Nocardioides donggukensis TaxID=2774019 RepID=A0A927Q0J8_9ACTN|nr:ATP-dependent DNA helicase RecG [Nocardioides donggukensis]MBD8869012.1 ATP-dependent DNA helicase RecG [Nocardioides donggukensis]